MSDQTFRDGLLDMLKEACEGGVPGQGTGFLENTKADGSDNAGLFATLDRLSAAQASAPTALGTSVAAHTAHLAYHLEVSIRWANGERGPFDWKGSFNPAAVDESEWKARRARVRAAYDAFAARCRTVTDWNEDEAGGLAASVAHLTYHLGAIRQIIKLAS